MSDQTTDDSAREREIRSHYGGLIDTSHRLYRQSARFASNNGRLSEGAELAHDRHRERGVAGADAPAFVERAIRM